MTCKDFRCRKKRRAVWTIDGKPVCNVCFLNWLDKHEVANQKIIRLFDDEALYDDCRRRRRPASAPSASAALPA